MKKQIKQVITIAALSPVTKQKIVALALTPITAFLLSCGNDKKPDEPIEPECVCPPQGEHFLTCEEYGCEIGGCEIDARNQSETIDLFEGKTATVKGKFTDTEWNDVAEKIANRLNNQFDSLSSDAAKNIYREVFDRDVTYIVESNPEGYTNVKTIGDGRTVYIALSNVDTTWVTSVIGTMYLYNSEIARAPVYTEAELFTRSIVAKLNIEQNIQRKIAFEKNVNTI